MSSSEKKLGDKQEKPGDEVKLGKKYAGEKFSTVVSAAQLTETRAEQAKHEGPNAITIEMYFSIMRITDPVKQSMMRACTSLTRASKEAFDDVFRSF
jgi:hypothetical protein